MQKMKFPFEINTASKAIINQNKIFPDNFYIPIIKAIILKRFGYSILRNLNFRNQILRNFELRKG